MGQKVIPLVLYYLDTVSTGCGRFSVGRNSYGIARFGRLLVLGTTIGRPLYLCPPVSLYSMSGSSLIPIRHTKEPDSKFERIPGTRRAFTCQTVVVDNA